ncbi:MAG: phosphotransferase family protein [Steroidobacteraceae bacterium]
MLSEIVESVRGNRTPEASHYIAEVIELERALHGRHPSQTHSITPQSAAAPLDESLRAYFSARMKDFEFLSMRQLPGGYTKNTVLVHARDRSGNDVYFVIRAERPPSQLRFDASDVRDEFQIIELVEAAGIPVAHPIRLEESREFIGQPFIVTTRAAGRTYGAHTGASEIPEAVVRSMVETLAGIHRIALGSLRSSPLTSWLQHDTLAENTKENVRRWRAQPWLPKADASPALARLASWLMDNVSNENITPTLLHVDYGPHNILAEADGVTAVLDWETCRIGDPAEDVAYLIQTTQGSVAREDILAWYHRAGGAPISEYRLRYFDVFTLLKFTVGTLAMAALVQADARASILHAEGAVLWWAHLPDIETRIRHAEAARR